MGEMALTKQENNAISAWAERGDVRELANRLQITIPGGKKLSEVEALTLAQAAVAHGLDPFNGEIWLIPGSGLMAGIKGHRRAAHRQIQEEGGGNYWPEFEGPLSADEKADLAIPQDALAFRCKLRDTQTIDHYVRTIERLGGAGLTWEIIEEVVGHRPYTPGVGYAMPNEPSKMTLVQRAMKRAEADALKRRFDLPFGAGVGSANDNDDVLEGEFVDTSRSLSQETLEEARASLRGDGKDPSEQVDPVVQAAVKDLGAEVAAWRTEWHAFTHYVMEKLPYYNHQKHITNTLRKETDNPEAVYWGREDTPSLNGDPDKLFAILEKHAQEAGK